MNKQSHVRIIFNLVLIVIVVISVVATGFVSIKEYRSNRIPEIYSDEQIAKVVKEEYFDFEFNKDDNWDVETRLADDNNSFTADVSIIRTKDLCRAHYGVQMTFRLVDGTWKPEDLPGEITLTKSEWLFENSNWSVISEEGTKFEVSFLSGLEARLCIQESTNSTPTEEVSVNVLAGGVAAEKTSVPDLDAKDLNKTLTCRLSESDDGKFLEGTFKVKYNESFLLVVTEDSVKLILSNESGELTLTKE